MEKIFKVIEDVMLIKQPIYLRRVDYSRISIKDGEDPGTFLRRIQASASAADMINCPLETQILLKFSQALNKTELNTCHKLKVFLKSIISLHLPNSYQQRSFLRRVFIQS